MSFSCENKIVIVGGGICGLATALALHRKGINSVVLEKADSLRAAGAAITIYTNGWRALDQLGVGAELRQKAIPIQMRRDISINDNVTQEVSSGSEEIRCLKRSCLIEALADSLPLETLRFGSGVIAVKMDPKNSCPLLHLQDGSVLSAKVLIGCDGVNSIVATSLGLKAPRLYALGEARGFTNYPNGHGFGNEFLLMKGDHLHVGRIPVDGRLVYWFVTRPWLREDLGISKEPELIKEATLKALSNLSIEIIEMVRNSDLHSLHLTQLRYRAPLDLLMGIFQKGTMTVAGDAMHVMGPFLGQGGCASLEDAIVLARCLAQEMKTVNDQQLQNRVGIAFNKYVKKRMLRVLRLSTQAHLVGLLLETSSMPKKVISGILLGFFGSRFSHCQYDCGYL